MQGWGSRAISGTPTSPHTGVTGRHWPITKIRFYFRSGCTCTTSIPRATTLSPPECLHAGRTQAPSSPALGRGDPPPRPCPAWAASATGASSRPTASSRASVSVVPAWARPLPPRVSSSLPPHCGLWAGVCWLRLPLPLSQVGAAGPRLISATLAGASPLAPSGSCPRGPSDCPAERGGRAAGTMGCLGGGFPAPAHCPPHHLLHGDPL